MTATEVKQIPKSVNNINQSQKDIQRSPICITNYDHYYIIDDTKQRDKIEYERKMSVDENYKYL